MTGRVRVVVFATAPPDDPAAVERAYHDISRTLSGTPGLRGNELLVSVADPRDYAVVSEWDDLAAFTAWEAGAAHKGATAPLRPFQRPSPATFGVYQITAAY